MQPAVAREHGRRAQSQFAACEIRKRTPGLAHDDGQRGDVEDIDVRLDDRLERAARERRGTSSGGLW
jgi:hypothetical protein